MGIGEGLEKFKFTFLNLCSYIYPAKIFKYSRQRRDELLQQTESKSEEGE